MASRRLGLRFGHFLKGQEAASSYKSLIGAVDLSPQGGRPRSPGHGLRCFPLGGTVKSDAYWADSPSNRKGLGAGTVVSPLSPAQFGLLASKVRKVSPSILPPRNCRESYLLGSPLLSSLNLVRPVYSQTHRIVTFPFKELNDQSYPSDAFAMTTNLRGAAPT